MAEDIKISVTLPRETVEKSRELAEANHMSVGTVITESVGFCYGEQSHR